MNRLRRFLRRPAQERALFVKALLLLGLVRLGLWLFPFQTLRRFLDRFAKAPNGQRSADGSSLDQVIWAVEAASRYVPGTRTCLVQALVARLLLVRRGHSVRLRIGVTKSEEGQLEAHAWVESEDGIVFGGEDSPSRFAPLPYLEGERL
jgi:hypothetical protein